MYLPRSVPYRLAVRFSPFWHADGPACLIRRTDGMTTVVPAHAGLLQLSFRVSAGSALAAVGGRQRICFRS
jgi:hypothetical protein